MFLTRTCDYMIGKHIEGTNTNQGPFGRDSVSYDLDIFVGH